MKAVRLPKLPFQAQSPPHRRAGRCAGRRRVHGRVQTDSSMFQANEACEGMGTLTVENGEMTFHVSLRSKKILNLYLGTVEDAKQNESEWLQPTTDTVTV